MAVVKCPSCGTAINVVEKIYKPGDALPDQEVAKHLSKGLDRLSCPKGGHYTLNPAGKAPACSVHGPLKQTPRGPSGTFDPGG